MSSFVRQFVYKVHQNGHFGEHRIRLLYRRIASDTSIESISILIGTTYEVIFAATVPALFGEVAPMVGGSWTWHAVSTVDILSRASERPCNTVFLTAYSRIVDHTKYIYSGAFRSYFKSPSSCHDASSNFWHDRNRSRICHEN